MSTTKAITVKQLAHILGFTPEYVIDRFKTVGITITDLEQPITQEQQKLFIETSKETKTEGTKKTLHLRKPSAPEGAIQKRVTSAIDVKVVKKPRAYKADEFLADIKRKTEEEKKKKLEKERKEKELLERKKQSEALAEKEKEAKKAKKVKTEGIKDTKSKTNEETFLKNQN